MNTLKQAQIFTPSHIANDMLDLLDQNVFFDDETYFFEPSVGNGNILIEILNRLWTMYELQRKNLPKERVFAEILYKFYACELDDDLVVECRERVWNWFDEKRKELDDKLLSDYLIANQIRFSIEKRNTLDFLSDDGKFSKHKVNQKRKLKG